MLAARSNELDRRPAGAGRPRDRARLAVRLGPIAVLLALVVAVGALSPSFLSAYSLGVLAAEASVILLLATGQTLVVLLGRIDLSTAAVASLVSVIVALALPKLGVAALPAAVLIAAAIGALHGIVHVQAGVPSFIVTLAGLGLWSGVALALAQTTVPVAPGDPLLDWLEAQPMGVPGAFALALVALALFHLVLARLRFGRDLRAIGFAERVARLSGVPVERVVVLAFAASGLCAGLAGVTMVARTGSGNPTIADALLLPTIAAVLIGGTAITGGHGSLLRTLLGVCIVVVLRVGVAVAGLAPAYEPIAYGVLVVVAVAATIDRQSIGSVR